MTLAGLHRFPLVEHIVHGESASLAVPRELERLGKGRAFLVTTASVARSSMLAPLTEALGPRLVGTYAGVTAHGPRQCVVDGAQAARAAGADILVAVGGGSAIDATKVMQLCLRHDIEHPDQLSAHVAQGRSEPSTRPDDADQWIRAVAVPTTLSAAEFTWFGGAYNDQLRVKESFSNPMMMPEVVVMDPAMTMETPPHLLLSTGMKAVDHATERLASLQVNPYNDAVSSLALRLLSDGLRSVRRDPRDIEARSAVQYGAFMSMCGGWAGATVGLGHAIGHALGGHSGVPHGETSSVLLPSVMRWNAPANAHRQRLVADALGGGQDAAELLADLVQALSLPARLRDVGVERAAFGSIAAKAAADPLTRNNPRVVSSPADIETVLDLAW
jgi:maleylacetate reductase